jgi:hypothetical protein
MFKSVSESESDHNVIILDDIKDQIINSGWLTKQGSKQKSWKKRFFVLTETFLYYFKESNPKSKSVGCIFLLGDIEYYHASRGDLECFKSPSLKFETPSRTLFAYSLDSKEIDEWINLFNETTKKNWNKTKNIDLDEPEPETSNQIDEEKITELKNDVEEKKKQLDDFIYGSYGVKDINAMKDGKIIPDEEFDALILNTKKAIKRFSGALEIFENNLRQESKKNLFEHEFVDDKTSFVQTLERKTSKLVKLTKK